MLTQVLWSETRDYKTGSENEPIEFYLEGLSNSTHFDLLLGYFSSAAVNLLAVGFATFLSKGGTVRLVINHILSEKDKIAIEKGLIEESSKGIFDITDIAKLKNILNEYDHHFFECLSWLIANKKITLKIIRPKGKKGISHYKSGIFSDGINRVAYKASCNFTLFGLSENLEELETFFSWEDGRSNILIKTQTEKFEKYYLETDDSVEYIDIAGIEIAIMHMFGNKDINELIVQEKELFNRKADLYKSSKVKKIANKLNKEIDKISNEPRFPYTEGPRIYQVNAYKNWKQNSDKGIFAMATGTGKTLTALNCILNEYKISNSYRAVIIVPTTALLDQWKAECKRFNFKNIICVSSVVNWEENFAFLNTASHFINTSFVIIVTYASFYKTKFQSHFKNLPKDTVLIGDEVHNMGSNSIARLLPSIHLEKRIGLSATPNRKFDETGNLAIEQFFNDSFPFIFSYSMKEAIDNNILCPYKYFPHIVRLTNAEMEEYVKISRQLLKYFDNATGNYRQCQEVDILLLKRKRVIHKAKNKKTIFKEILKHEFEQKLHLKYTLVYVPEGIESNYEEFDNLPDDEENISLIDEYTKIISNINNSVFVKQFTSNTPNRNKIINDFSQGITHVLTSMKCLDEGVDVPRAELAIFCSSTGNPRQFIQRRGRILRRHKDKTYAVIHDLVVIPSSSNADETYEMERGLVRKELERVVNFSYLADNKSNTYQIFREILDVYNLNLNDFEN